MNKWKYKIDISCNGVFGEIEKKYGIKFSDELKAFITEYNAATPEKHRFMVGTTERVFGAVLSVNKGETDTDSIYTALDVINDKDIIPFAIDPFGNYICYSTNDGIVMYWDHENDTTASTNLNLSDFIASLY